jgi:hypothetical protein
MSDSTQVARLQAKKKQLRLLMGVMLAFMVLNPLIAPKLFSDEFAQLRGVGLYVFYIGSTAIFGALFLFYLVLYRRTEKKIKDQA